MNRISILTIIFVTLLFVTTFAQIDMLMLVEIGSIQTSSEITQLYVEDLDGDSLKEIILCTDYYVYIYNSQTYQVEWTSPPLNGPTDLLFEDINNDGLIDFSVQDNTNIHLFDPHTPQTIWASPPLDSTYKCYTIGDRNNDDWIDVAIVAKEWFTRPYIEDNMDTVWIDIYNGPDFIQEDQLLLLMANYSMGSGGDSWARSENPEFTCISEFNNNGERNSIMTLFTTIELHSTGPMQSYSNSTIGDVWFINSENLYLLFTDSCGYLLDFRIINQGDLTILYTLGQKYRYYGSIYGDYRDRYKYVNSFSGDSLLSSAVLWGYDNGTGSDWSGHLWGDIIMANPGDEIYFSVAQNQTLVSLPPIDTLWQAATQPGFVKFIYNNPVIFSNPHIIFKMYYRPFEYNFYSGFNGFLTAILTDSLYELSQIADLNGDSNDEILSIQGGVLYIFDLAYATGVDDDSRIPIGAFLLPNYPNPFNSATTIEYGLPEPGRVRIDIYDLLGRKVETLIDEEMQAGRHQAVWDASGYSSGVYFYRLLAGEMVETKRMVFLK